MSISQIPMTNDNAKIVKIIENFLTIVLQSLLNPDGQDMIEIKSILDCVCIHGEPSLMQDAQIEHSHYSN